MRSTLAALPLVMSCGERSPTGPAGSMPPASRTIASAPIFVIEPTLIDIPTYDGSGQSVHPDVVEFSQPWHGARYWLTVTPYPKSDQRLENPSILASDDGIHVRVPDGLTNPVIHAPRRTRDYNSDPELSYEPQSDRLVLIYRLVERKTNTVHVATSRDGVKWTEIAAPFWEHGHAVVSPTVAPRMGAPTRIWYVDAGKRGCDATSTRVVTRVGTDTSGNVVGSKWTSRTVTDLRIPGYNVWHIKARWVPEKAEYWMLISAFPVGGDGCHTDDLFFARSADGLHWTAYSEPIMRHEERPWTAAAVYRSTFLYDAVTDEMSLWISARGADGAWHIGYARAHYQELLHALAADRPLAPATGHLYHAQTGLQQASP